MVDEIKIDYRNIEKVSSLFDFELSEAILLRKSAEPVYMTDISRDVMLETNSFKVRPKRTEYYDGKIEENAIINCNVGDSILLHETSSMVKILDFEELEKHFKKLSESYRTKNKKVSE